MPRICFCGTCGESVLCLPPTGPARHARPSPTWLPVPAADNDDQDVPEASAGVVLAFRQRGPRRRRR
ncbi:hypothetical protein [Streptomyces sp. HUAS TT7]|uniref:hypothetical protein n=1 Tax=Streptomyces sp. HUAS TT7 TaxID=3447507 RepID=UPI003F657C69